MLAKLSNDAFEEYDSFVNKGRLCVQMYSVDWIVDWSEPASPSHSPLPVMALAPVEAERDRQVRLRERQATAIGDVEA